MRPLSVFSDGSVNTKSKTGCGAGLMVSDLDAPLDTLQALVKVQRFEHTSSTKLELQALLWVLKRVMELDVVDRHSVTVYTDSQNIVGLLRRRERLEKSDYISSKNRRLNNYELYQEFYRCFDQLKFKVVKVKGHQPSYQMDKIDKIFSLVDQASRHALRADVG